MTFGQALEALKQGKTVARKGWNDVGMWVRLVKQGEFDISFEVVGGNKCKGLLPWIGMKTVDDTFVPWLASQTDMLAEDWEVVE
ncbi:MULTISPECIES: DUF2829 domain-containing protein [Bacillus]|uniref:DUF2829 domain-containing protein n=5 Tax=Bacillus thuringiensis TaxID=1428 RepID=A0A9X6KGX4_BACTU|nr:MULTISPECIES: DUF2829 domain-containing protein [Bacillus]MED1153272.1 DUF2829 domain-containing protein [Bacillus paranthracis]AEA14326.1 hypothetical protein CT43_CH0634 [Bacillus thuringiensis serovar chinensis CT-43]AFQ27320.1 hypothetical protein BTF1_15725 [Bacillus thuringiensis HD-789]AFV16447.1 hypothetical protein BTB_c07290 [Bacillus thuringiensis Bt407]AGF99353.1 hypothetical protein H175_ch0640 [Bacillus thuringiensis serovar thuringiensis str. IS5056]